MLKRLGVMFAVLLLAAPAWGQTLDAALDERTEARSGLEAAQGEFEVLEARYDKVLAKAEAAAARLVDALMLQSELQAEVAESRALLNGRADAIYRAGPGAFMEVFLGSTGPGDYLARQELVERALGDGIEEAAAALEEKREAGDLVRELEEARTELVEHQSRLAEIRYVMELRVAEARSELDAADSRVKEIQRQEQVLTDATELEQHYLDLIEVDGELAELLEMLGPTGGRGCEIPPALESTGQVFSGESSFYGEEFAGNPTAIGHIFNPALFTAAHLTLPLPSFLHVTYGGRCATVLVNDRGPYIDGRILDLSEGAAMYLGLPGVGDVRAEVLKPA